MRKKIVAGNWKMNNDLAETEMFLVELKKQVFPEDVVVMIAPPFTNLNHTFRSLREHPVVLVAQNMHQSNEGAFTGEISAETKLSSGFDTIFDRKPLKNYISVLTFLKNPDSGGQ